MDMTGSIPRRQAVTDTSAEAYRTEAAKIQHRARFVFLWLESFSVCASPTSAELAKAVEGFAAVEGMDATQRLLYVRRGLSDLKAKGKAEHAQPRICTVSGRRCETWIVTPERP